MVNGPIFVGVDYECTREIVGSGETPRAEFRPTPSSLCSCSVIRMTRRGFAVMVWCER